MKITISLEEYLQAGGLLENIDISKTFFCGIIENVPIKSISQGKFKDGIRLYSAVEDEDGFMSSSCKRR